MDQHKPMSLTKTALRSGLAAFAVTLVALGGAELSWSEGQAQTIAAHNSRAPVSFDAGRIELQDRENRVALSGQVVVRQADLTVQSDRMLVNYTDADSLDVQRITASGGVTVSRGNERASGDVAVYDFGRRIITLAGNVSLRRGSDVLNGGRLVIDLQSGRSSVDGRMAGTPLSTDGSTRQDGRVTGSFSVPQDNNDTP
jgi:lipopolysaccharide export system protein LptA